MIKYQECGLDMTLMGAGRWWRCEICGAWIKPRCFNPADAFWEAYYETYKMIDEDCRDED